MLVPPVTSGPPSGLSTECINMHVLLTGASGFLGSVCCDLLSNQPNVRLSLLRSGCGNSLKTACAQHFDGAKAKTSLDLITVIGDAPPTHILHIGALSSPDVCEREPDKAYTANVSSTKILAEYAALVGAHLTTVSTDLVFDGRKAPEMGLQESELANPISVYGRTKRSAEEVTLSASMNAVVRLSLIYGHSPSDSAGVLGWMERSFVNQIPLSLFEDEFRTPIHVRDAAKALAHISIHKLAGLWHCGGPARLSRVEFGMQVARALHYNEGLIKPTLRQSHATIPPRPEDVSLNSQKLWNELSWTPNPVHEALCMYPKK